MGVMNSYTSFTILSKTISFIITKVKLLIINILCMDNYIPNKHSSTFISHYHFCPHQPPHAIGSWPLLTNTLATNDHTPKLHRPFFLSIRQMNQEFYEVGGYIILFYSIW